MKKLLLGGACAASLLLALTPLAQAADIEPVPEPVGLGWYVSVFGGASFAKDENFYVLNSYYVGSPSFSDFYQSFDADLDLDTGFMVGAALGASFNDWLRGEVEVSGNFHDVTGSGYYYNDTYCCGTYSGDVDLDGDENALFVLANLWVDLPFGGMFKPYIGGGVGAGRIDLELTGDYNGTDLDIIDDAGWGFAYQVGGGVAFEVAPNWAIDVGYRYKAINNVDLELEDDVTLGGDNDEIEKDYKSHNVLVGLRFGF
jgi:opacity protein-like surface antigen